MLATVPDPGTARFGEAAHGVAGWPFDAEPSPPLPLALPDGSPWPSVTVIVLEGGDATDLAATLAAIHRQTYPALDHRIAAASPSTFERSVAGRDADAVIVLRAGDLLAPDAVAAMAFEAAMTGAQVVTGLRVLYDRAVLAIDVVAHPPGRIGATAPAILDAAPPGFGEWLLDRRAIERAGGLDLSGTQPMADLWRRMAANGARLARVGRPVVLQRVDAEAHGAHPPAAGLSIVSLTDIGYTAGAGIAHRRLAEALSLAGHRIAHVRLADESPPAAAEWTDAFPRSEQAILAGGHDLVLAGNLHGTTRSTRVLARLGKHLPVVAVLHDLFPLTGRCAFPKGCAIIASGCSAACPSPDYYPQLAPSRIARAHADKRDVLVEAGAPLLLANSAWTREAARDLAPASTRIAQIDLAFPTGVFRPGDRADLRRRLGLPPDDVIVMFGAVIVDAPGKGFADLVAIFRRVARPGIRFVAAGRLDDPSVFGLPDLISTGPIGDEAVLADWYRACDVYLTASQTETLGQTPIEAGLCGTPTVAYRSCGLTTAVIDGVSGLLAPTDPMALAALLARLIDDAGLRRDLGAWGRIALENRNSYAAAALRFDDVARREGFAASSALGGRVRLSPDLLGYYAFAARRHPGETGTVPADSGAATRYLRRAKHAVLGRGMPPWLRRFLHLASLARRRLNGTSR
ncbi:glycosyltransferase [Methylobacterium sp. Leaf399]|uniref:glycosyltransferase n=1 Tax=Methylobacterium sp. Leaf399 TaxID=1736364 RepID=UPI000B00FA60|nr:glycosyltransferase [Methylobacterium sp. Leaf399]